MAELKRSEHESLGGSGFSDETFFGGIIAGLRNLFMPSKAEQVNGVHYLSEINRMSAIGRQLEAVNSLRVYKDDTDADDEFSVAAGTHDLHGMTCTYAGEVNLGTLAVGTNYIWAVLGPTITIEFDDALPTHHLPIVVLGVIEQPSSGPWKPQHFTPWLDRCDLNVPRAAARIIRKDITIADDGAITLESVPSGAIVKSAVVIVHTAFDGSAPTLDVGDAGDADRLAAAADVDLTTAGTYELTPGYRYAALTALTAALDIDGSTVGEATILLEVV